MKNRNELKFGMYIHWTLLQACNFKCQYCPSKHFRGKNPPNPLDIQKIIERINKFDEKLLITLTGGEPFLIPNFVEFVHQLTQKHYIRIDTNLSLKKNIGKFIKLINPEKVVEIVFSVHVSERIKRNLSLYDLCELVKRFKEKNFKVIGNYVLYPPLLERAENDIIFFINKGINVVPTLFYGTFNNKTYPFCKGVISYSKKEIELINKYNPCAIGIIKNRKSIPCHAGTAAFAINPEYKITPCVVLKKKLGDFYGQWKRFPKVIRCPINNCTCAFNEDFLVSHGTIYPNRLTEKTISKYGVYSITESFKATICFDQFILNIAHQMGAYDTIKKAYRRFYPKIS